MKHEDPPEGMYEQVDDSGRKEVEIQRVHQSVSRY